MLLAPLFALPSLLGGPPTVAPSGAHPGAPLYIVVWIQEEFVEVQFHGEQRTVNPWLGVEGIHVPPVDESARAAAEAAAPDLFTAHASVAVDGVSAAGEVVDVVLEGPTPANPEPMVRMYTRYPCAGRPDRVRFGWDRFDEDGWPITVLFRSDDQPAEFQEISTVEPACDWITLGVNAPRGGGGPLEPVAPGRRPETQRWRWPLGILGGAGLLAALLRGSLLRVACLLVGLAGAAVAWTTSGLDPEAVVEPDESEALEIFQALHRRIYHSFVAESEETIYELLASAVDEDILDELYGEIYESLVLRNEGGAFCRVDSLTPILSRVELFAEDDDPVYEVEYAWRVEGSVRHWSHEHQRTNVYRALYTIAHDGAGWKIASWEVLEHKRADDGRSFTTLIGDDEEYEDEEYDDAELDDEEDE